MVFFLNYLLVRNLQSFNLKSESLNCFELETVWNVTRRSILLSSSDEDIFEPKRNEIVKNFSEKDLKHRRLVMLEERENIYFKIIITLDPINTWISTCLCTIKKVALLFYVPSENCTEFKLNNCKLNKIIILLQICFSSICYYYMYFPYWIKKIASHSYLEVRAPWRSSSGFSWRSPTRVSTSRRMRRSSSATKLRTVWLPATYNHSILSR